MKRIKAIFGVYVLTLVITIFAYQLPIRANANETMAQSEGIILAPSEPQLSQDGNTLYFGVPFKAVIKDPNPPVIPRRILAPAWMKAMPEGAATDAFAITYIDKGETDLWGNTCETFPQEAKTAFNAAAEIWGNILKSSVPITIKACWTYLTGEDANTLGRTGGIPWKKNFSRAPRKDTFYASSLANALAGSDLDPDMFDMHITYNRNINWYYDTVGNIPTGPAAIANGNFESGSASWTESSPGDLIGEWNRNKVPSHGGTWYTWLGGANDEADYIEQTVTVPSSYLNLVFYHWIASNDSCGEDYAYDFGYVSVSKNGTDWKDVATIPLCNAFDTNRWRRKEIDLSDYANKKVDLRIRVETDGRDISNWYIDTVFFQADTYDLVTVALHEICHGLNFYDSMYIKDKIGAWGVGMPTFDPNIFDVFIKDGEGKYLINSYKNFSTALGTALTSNDLWFHGPKAMAANGRQRVKIYAPSEYDSGSSIGHLDYDTFDNTPNQLMVWAVAAGEVVHDPGPITKALLNDLGWSTRTSAVAPCIVPLLLD